MSLKVLQIVTDRVLAALDKGIVPWRKPWNSARPMNIMGYPYRGINFFLLSMLAHPTPVYLTFNQIKQKGGRIKAGEEKKHVPVFFWKILSYTKDRSGVELDDPRTVPLVRYTQVWNIDQVEGVELPKRFKAQRDAVPVLEAAEAIAAGYKAAPTVKHGGNRACYIPALDIVHMPNRDDFNGDNGAEEYYSALFHEFAHSTGHKTRLNRREVMEAEYDHHAERYSAEELVAEMTAAMLCSYAGIDNTLENSVAYIAGWACRLKRDPKVLMTAAARAQKAAAYIAPQFNADETEDEEKAAA